MESDNEQQQKEHPDASNSDESAPPGFSFTDENFPLDRYEPVKIIGKGTVGTIYLCLDRRLLHKKVAVKLLRGVFEEQLVSFHQEARATSRLNHRNIIAVYDFGVTSGGVPFMAMEYADGVNLDKLIAHQGPLDQDNAIKIIAALADALSYAHSRGIFHRDIKTSNILLVDSESKLPDVRLIDFGVAAIQHKKDESFKVQGRTIVGTPQYMSPDQCYGMSYDERSEIYSLGCVMFELLTGKPPFQGDTALEIIAMHAKEPTPSLSGRHGGISFNNAIESIVAKCLAKNRDDRYSSMFALKADLDSIIERDYSITIDGLHLDGQAGKSQHHDRDPILSAIMVSLVCFSAASWLLYTQLERVLSSKNVTASVKSSQRKIDLTLPTLDEYGVDSGKTFIREYSFGRLMMEALRPITDEDLKKLATERNINELKLQAPNLNGSGFRFLSSASLVRLVINDSKLSDECLKSIATLKNLRYLEFVDCEGITHDGIQNLKDLPLNTLTVTGCGLSNEDMLAINEIRSLSALDISNNKKISQDAITRLTESNKLQAFAISPEQMGDGCYETLARINTLQTLTFSGSKPIDDTNLVLLRSLPELNRMVFAGSCLPAKTIPILLAFPSLQRLEFTGKEYSDDHLAMLDGAKIRTLVLSDCAITDSGFAHIVKMPKLQRVNLKRCSSVTFACINELSKRLPGCDIVVF